MSMNSKEYLDIRWRQDELLSGIDDTTPEDDQRIAEILSLQDLCDEYESETFHKYGYVRIRVRCDPKALIKAIRLAHEAGMNLSDFIGMLIWRNLDEKSLPFSWTTDIRDGAGLNLKGNAFLPIPTPIMKSLGWHTGDFIRITSSKEGLAFTGFEFDDEYR